MELQLLERNIDIAVGLLKALSNERRLMIVCSLYEGEMSVSALEKHIGISQSALSQHLAKLRNDGLVQTRRDAQTIYYSLNSQAANAMLHTLHEIFCPD